MINGLTEKEVNEIKSLITLIDDEDDSVYRAARERLLQYKDDALNYIPLVEERTTVSEKRLGEIREILLRSTFREQLRNVKRLSNGDIDLEEGVFLLARQRYRGLEIAKYVDQLNGYAAQLKEKLSSVTDETEILRRIVQFFAEEKAFLGNRNEYYSEENHYINRVLDTKIGIPITLSVVYMLVGQRINLPLKGIGLPGHFILRFSFGNIHRYIDPYNSGTTLSKSDCEDIVKNLGFTFTEEYLQPVSHKQILERMLRNIILTLEKKQETDRIETIRQFIDTLNSDL